MVVAATHMSEMCMKSCASLCSCKRQAARQAVTVLLNNQEASLQLQGTPVCSSQSTFLEFQKVAKEWPKSGPRALTASQH